MAPRAMKRLKVEHTSSDHEEDDASYASFGGDEHDAPETEGHSTVGHVIDGGWGEKKDELDIGDANDGVEYRMEEEQDEDEDEDEDDDADEDSVGIDQLQPKSASSPSRSKMIQKDRKNARHPPLSTSGSVNTSGSLKSNLFKLQIEELLSQIRQRRGKKEEDAEKALRALKTTIDATAPVAPLSIAEARRRLLKHKVAVPFPAPGPPKDAMYKLEYAKPAAVNVTGSYVLKTQSRSNELLSMDMMIVMPDALFQEKDYLNHRYFYKRAYYLACLASAIHAALGHIYNIHFSEFRDDHLKPVLEITPLAQQKPDNAESKPAAKWCINVIPCLNAEVFAAEKLLPSKNSVRPADESIQAAPTPFYNASLRADMLVKSYLRVLHDTASRCEAFRDACLLGATWLRQRGFGSSSAGGGFGNFEWAAFIASMLQGGGASGKPLLSDSYSSYQLFKATLQALAVRDLSKQALVIGDAAVMPVGDGSPMVWDAARSHNILYNLTPWAYPQLRQEARLTLTTLADQLYDGFGAAFITKKTGTLPRYDYTINVQSPVASSTVQLYEILKRGLGDRVSLIVLQPRSASSWQLGTMRPIVGTWVVTIGLAVNPDTVNRTVDHGPPAESKEEAASFRKFWGEKAELRRFKDGSISESLVWSVDERGYGVLEQVVRFLLGKHFGLVADDQVSFTEADFVSLLRQGARTSGFHELTEAYKQLETDIRGLDGLPLSIRQIMPADAQLRYASTRPPGNVTGQERTQPANVTIQFEGSTRWPDDLVAIQRTKIAFLLKLGELLQEAHSSITARVGLENPHDEILNQGYLDIVHARGPAFRMRIYHDREQTLLEQQLKDKSVAPSAKEAAAQALAVYKRDYIRGPAHTQAVSRLCNRYPPLSGTMRLLKKWFASHLLTNHVAEEVVELIAIRTFVQPYPWGTPSSIRTGFLRTLHWLARWDWRIEPVIVDLSGSGELKPAHAQAMRSRFEAWRKLDPSLNRTVLFAASSVDADGITFTDGRPSRVVAGRMTALAKAACQEVEEKGLSLQPRSLFASALEDYDFVMHLDVGKKRKSAQYKNLELATLDDPALVGFDSATLFLQELEALYGSAIVFFYGGAERPIIAGLWSPQTAPRVWKMNLAYSALPTKTSKDGEVMAAINKTAIVAEIARLGGDLIDKIDVR
ncbi:hypothetical protein LTR62_002126 [Meristemomyces frigidus]|uniref:U3 small nucleolar RNA-associated protein 22 n=1 Tax=Meristemomyces frigidus TaxID=1508187 RepID=A0AAN7T8K7_9PEZI|nr:hypothetical protein LTR62_002126 [Meristemomyces frigidus]